MSIGIGRIVHYVLNEQDAEQINRRRAPGAGHNTGWVEGSQAHVGNRSQADETYPLLVTRVWPDYAGVNGQVLLDGNDVLWVTSVKEGTGPGTWHWPERK